MIIMTFCFHLDCHRGLNGWLLGSAIQSLANYIASQTENPIVSSFCLTSFYVFVPVAHISSAFSRSQLGEE